MRFNQRYGERRGASAVEFAITLPMVVAFLLASVEFGRAIQVNHSVQEAAQAACRVYSVRTATQAQADTIIETAMSQAGIDNYQVVYDPPNKEAITTHLAPVTVTLSVNYNNVGWITGTFMNDATISGRAIMPADLEIIDDYDPINPIEEDDDPVTPPPDDDDDDGGNDDDDDNNGGWGPRPWYWPPPLPWPIW